MADITAGAIELPRERDEDAEQKGHPAGKAVFTGLAVVLIPLKVLEFGMDTSWSFVSDIVNIQTTHWSQAHWHDWIGLFVILLEGAAAAAAITIAFVSVTILNKNTSNYISAVWKTIVGPDRNKSPYVRVDQSTGKLMETFLANGASALKAERDALKLRVDELEKQLKVDDSIFDSLIKFAENIKTTRDPNGTGTR